MMTNARKRTPLISPILFGAVNELQGKLDAMLNVCIDNAQHPNLPTMMRIASGFGAAVALMCAITGKATQISFKSLELASEILDEILAIDVKNPLRENQKSASTTQIYATIGTPTLQADTRLQTQASANPATQTASSITSVNEPDASPRFRR